MAGCFPRLLVNFEGNQDASMSLDPNSPPQSLYSGKGNKAGGQARERARSIEGEVTTKPTCASLHVNSVTFVNPPMNVTPLRVCHKGRMRLTIAMAPAQYTD